MNTGRDNVTNRDGSVGDNVSDERAAIHVPCVRWINRNTGEVKERALRGRNPIIWSALAPSNPTGKPQFRGEFEEWEMTALEMALALVPDLETVIDRALLQGMSVELHVKAVGK